MALLYEKYIKYNAAVLDFLVKLFYCKYIYCDAMAVITIETVS
jgi:hypothetical protein